jgi:SAM-dependent methyltransferase
LLGIRSVSQAASGAAGNTDYYDELAAHYPSLVPDWPGAMQRQAAALDRIIGRHTAGPSRILDCSCGVGTQSIGLARAGHRVTGTDLSSRALERARLAALEADIYLDLHTADMCDLGPELGTFDVVLSCDNSFPHLTSIGAARQALVSMRRRLRPHGLLAISMRDYDLHRRSRPTATAPQVFTDACGAATVSFQTWEWLDADCYRARQFLLSCQPGCSTWTTRTFDGAVFRAFTRAEVSAATEAAGFHEVRWLTCAESGYHQPLMLARRPA